MIEQASIPGYLTTAQAAKATGLTAHRIGCLARAGEIGAAKSGNSLLVEASSLHRYAQANQGRGRPMDADTAFAALWLLSGLEADWLPYARERRLRKRLESSTAEELAWQLRKRAETHRYRASESFADRLAERLALSGCSSSRFGEMGLVMRHGTVEGYCLASELDDIETSFVLVKDSNGNAIIHAAQRLPETHEGEMPEAVVAADLTQSLDAREREAGISTLRRLLDEYREA